jgi:ribosomal protein S18 acetylase RimI-like enzyme
MNFPPSEIEVHVVPAERRVEALWQLFAWEPESQRRDRLAACLDVGRSDPQAFQFLFEAVCNNVRLGNVWGYVTPGRIANVWPAVCFANAAPGVRDVLQSTLDQHLTAAGVDCGQSLLPTNAEPLADILFRNGYRHAAQILFLACERSRFSNQPPLSELRFEVVQHDQQLRLEKLIDETYLGSLDAPILNGVRATRDVIDGYRQIGNHLPERWFFVRYQDRDVGCLLLTEHRHGSQWELIYMGLEPTARGRGWGEVITRYAQWLASESSCSVLLLGVDADNHPGIATYTRCGFHELDRRWALIKKFNVSD